MCFLNTEKVPLGECCAISETCEMLIFLMVLMIPNENYTKKFRLTGENGRSSSSLRMVIPGFSLKSKELIVLASALPIFELARVIVRLDHVPPLHRKRESQHHVSDCKTLRSRSHC